MAFSDRATSIAAAVALALHPGRAKAEPDVESLGAAQALFDSAVAAMERGDLADACPKLAEVVRLVPEGLGAKLRLADCHERAGRTASAWSTYLLVENDAVRLGQPARGDFARERAAALQPKLLRVTIAVRESVASTPGLEILRGSRRVERPEWGLAVPVDPGSLVVAARAPGRRAWEATIEVTAHATVDVPELEVLDHAPAATLPALAPRATASPAPMNATHSSPPGWVYAVGAAGLATSAVATIFLFDQLAIQSEIDEACPNGPCRAGFDVDGSNDRLHRDFGLFVGFGVVSVAALGAAAIGWATADGGSATPSVSRPGRRPSLTVPF